MSEFDANNPPELCDGCPDLDNEAFLGFGLKELHGLSCRYCGLPIIQNRTMLKVIQRVSEEA